MRTSQRDVVAMGTEVDGIDSVEQIPFLHDCCTDTAQPASSPPQPAAVPPLGLGLAALGRPGDINLGHDSAIGAQKDVEV